MMRKLWTHFGVWHTLVAFVVLGVGVAYVVRLSKPRVTYGEAISGLTFRFDYQPDESAVSRINNVFSGELFWNSLRSDLERSHGEILKQWSRNRISCEARIGLDGCLRVDFSAPGYSVTYLSFDRKRGVVRAHGYSKDKRIAGAHNDARTKQADLFHVVRQRIETVVASQLSRSQRRKETDE